MILCQIREHRCIIPAALHTILIERMGGYLHHRVGAAFRRHQRHHALQIIGIGRGVPGRQHALPDHVLNRPDQPDLVTSGLQNGFEQVRGSCLAIGASDAHKMQPPGGIAKPVCTHVCPGYAGGRHQQLAVQSEIPFADNRRSTGLFCLFGKLMAVHRRTADADKHPTGFHTAGIAGDPFHLDIRRRYAAAFHKLCQLHHTLVSFLSCRGQENAIRRRYGHPPLRRQNPPL